ncbi:MAG: efflux RND transporter periplasmic adaptor subunit [Candidatus Omnitrophota bacterium]
MKQSQMKKVYDLLLNKTTIINKYVVGLLVIVLMGLMIQCGKTTAEPSTDKEPSPAESRVLKLDPQLIKEWKIRYASPEFREYTEKIALNGVIKENKDTTFWVNTPVSGMVSEIKKDTGQSVAKGDVLCVLNSPELLELKTRYMKAFQDFNLKKENFERAKKLMQFKGLEQKEFTVRESDYKIAMADYFSLDAQLNTIGFDQKMLQSVTNAMTQDQPEKVKAFLSPFYPILSPSSGKVMMRELSLGERVENNKPVYEVSDTRNLWVVFDASEKDIQHIEKGKPVTIVSDVYPERRFSGMIQTVDERIDPELRTVKVRAEVENTDGRLKPEMYVKGWIEIRGQAKETIPAVPSGSVIKLAGIDGVFVFTGEAFLFKPVEVKERDAKGYVFVNGLNATDRVVVDGAFYLKSEVALQGESGE